MTPQPTEKADKFFNQQNWPALQVNIAKASSEVFAKFGPFELVNRENPTNKAHQVMNYVEKTADKYSIKRSVLFEVYFGL